MAFRPDVPALTSADQTEIAIPYRLNRAYLTGQHIGLLPGIDERYLAQVKDVLEIGCGPGGWTLQAARTYPDKRITGIDSSTAMITYAHHLASTQSLVNVHHMIVPSLVGPFDAWPDASFDLICAQSLSTSLLPCYWPSLLAECWRLLRPEGSICLTDFEMGVSNSPAHEEFVTLLLRAIAKIGQNMVPTERHLGVLCELEPLMSNAGFQDTRILPHLVNYSYGMASSMEWKMDFLLFCQLCRALIIRAEIATHAYLETLSRQLKLEMSLPTFHACIQGITVQGTK